MDQNIESYGLIWEKGTVGGAEDINTSRQEDKGLDFIFGAQIFLIRVLIA